MTEALFKGHPASGEPHDEDRQDDQRDYNNSEVEDAHSPLVRLHALSTPF
jgi:hypothetical protein